MGHQEPRRLQKTATSVLKLPSKLTRIFPVLVGGRRGAPVVFGFVLGIFLAINSTKESLECPAEVPEEPVKVSHHFSQSPLRSNHSEHDGNDWEPNLLFDNRKIPPSVQNAPHPVRPRYYASELGIHETLFVAIASSEATLETLAVAWNRTAAHYLSHVTFFLRSSSPDLASKYANLSSMNIIRSTAEDQDGLRASVMLKFISENHVETFDWFFIAPDSLYVDGTELVKFVKKISVGRAVYMGVPVDQGAAANAVCAFNAGILISQALMRGIAEQIPWCLENAVSHDFSMDLGRCVHQAAGLTCNQRFQGDVFPSFQLPTGNVLSDGISARNYVETSQELQSAITIRSLSYPEQFYRLHMELSKIKIVETAAKIIELQQDIVQQSPNTPTKGSDLLWPIGLNAPSIPKNRFDVIEWMSFNQTHIMRPDDFHVAKKLIGANLLDVQEVLKFAENQFSGIKLSRFINGYRRFDPTRGMEYIVDLAFQSDDGADIVKRVRLLRALGKMEPISMPFVTENSRVHLTVSITLQDVADALKFIIHFADTHLDAQDNVFLMMIFIYGPNDPGKGTAGDIFSSVKRKAKEIEKRFTKALGTRLSWINIRNPLTVAPSELAVMDLVARKFTKDSIIFRCTVHSILSGDLLNRVRLSTIPVWQVFFPMPFIQYKPSITYAAPPYPGDFDIKRQHGHFDRNSLEFAGFYISDYLLARKTVMNEWPLVNTEQDLLKHYPRPNRNGKVYDIYTLFLNTDLHLFRAVEPNLKVAFSLLHCDKDPDLDKRVLERCQLRLMESLANKQQLAMFVSRQESSAKA